MNGGGHLSSAPVGPACRKLTPLPTATKPTTGVRIRVLSTRTPTPPSPNVPRAHCGGGEAVRLPEGAADRSGGRRDEQRAHKIMLASAQTFAAKHTASLGTREFHPSAITRALDPLPSRRILIVSLKHRALTHWIKSSALHTVLRQISSKLL